MAIDLSNYEDCATLNKWFQGNYPMGSMRILDKHIEVIKDKDGNRIDELFIATTGVYRDNNDTNPTVMNIARGLQSEYPKHMQRFFAEDVITSSYGRCLALLKATDKTATKNDMRKVDDAPIKNIYGRSGNAQVIEMALRKSFADDANAGEQQEKAQSTDPTTWSIGDVSEALQTKPKQQECTHGVMILKEGTAKTGKPYYGYVCSAPKGDQCSAKWAVTAANGSWFFREED
jgi:hypothetical protein